MKYHIEVTVLSGEYCGVEENFTLCGEEWDNVIISNPNIEKETLLELVYETSDYSMAETIVKLSALEEREDNEDDEEQGNWLDLTVYEEIMIINTETKESWRLL